MFNITNLNLRLKITKPRLKIISLRLRIIRHKSRNTKRNLKQLLSLLQLKELPQLKRKQQGQALIQIVLKAISQPIVAVQNVVVNGLQIIVLSMVQVV